MSAGYERYLNKVIIINIITARMSLAPIIQSSFCHPTLFKTVPLVSFRRLLTSRKLAIHGPPVSDQCYQTNRQQCSMVCTVIDNS